MGRSETDIWVGGWTDRHSPVSAWQTVGALYMMVISIPLISSSRYHRVVAEI